VSAFGHSETISTEVWHGQAYSAREVILSAGAIGSPHILLLWGVGDTERLAKIGVPVAHELRGVGKNMQDHYAARVSYPIVGAQTANERSRGLPLAGEVVRWIFTGKGMLTYSPSIVAASVKVLEESATPDMQRTFAPGSFKGGQIGELEETPGFSAGAWQMRPQAPLSQEFYRPSLPRSKTRVGMRNPGQGRSPVMSNRHARQPPKDQTITLADRRSRGIALRESS
jgi:choline dehydrogenase-like flavoprotein